MAQQQHAADVHPNELCPPNKRYDLMDANKKVDLGQVQCPPESKILTNIIKNHSLRFSIAASSSVPWIYMARFWHTLKEDQSIGSESIRFYNGVKDTIEFQDYWSSAAMTNVMQNILQMLNNTRSTRITPPVPVPNVNKADEMILQDTLQVSLAEHKSHEEQEARENVALVDEHLAFEEIEKMESPKVEIAKEKEVEISKEKEVELTNVVIPVNVNDEDEEINDKVYELKRMEKGKIVEETRNSPIPTPIRPPRIHTNLVSLDTEKLQELIDTPHTTSSSSSPHKKLAKTNRLLSLFKTKPTRFKRYKSFFHELQGRYGYLFARLRARFMP
ncbi:hypothetical protein Tco_0070777, partial [Tanacetum coccineum]